jgi:hypothetical protein
MRTWIFGGCLAVVTAGGVGFVVSGGGKLSHCGLCVDPTRARPATAPAPVEPAGGSSAPPVVEVVDIDAELAIPAGPAPAPFVSFDEPPLARPRVGQDPAPELIPASFAEAAPAIERAPLPRLVRPDRGPMPMALPDDPF